MPTRLRLAPSWRRTRLTGGRCRRQGAPAAWTTRSALPCRRSRRGSASGPADILPRPQPRKGRRRPPAGPPRTRLPRTRLPPRLPWPGSPRMCLPQRSPPRTRLLRLNHHCFSPRRPTLSPRRRRPSRFHLTSRRQQPSRFRLTSRRRLRPPQPRPFPRRRPNPLLLRWRSSLRFLKPPKRRLHSRILKRRAGPRVLKRRPPRPILPSSLRSRLSLQRRPSPRRPCRRPCLSPQRRSLHPSPKRRPRPCLPLKRRLPRLSPKQRPPRLPLLQFPRPRRLTRSSATRFPPTSPVLLFGRRLTSPTPASGSVRLSAPPLL
jgi:hypothetical protein